MGALDDLMDAWRIEPDAERTLALCVAIRQPEHAAVAHDLLALARSQFSTDSAVLLEVGRMLVRVGMLAEAQTPLALAGKASRGDWRPFLELGHLLLLRGDAVRGGQAFRRAQALGCHVAALPAWLALADELGPLQQSPDGPAAVVAEVRRRALSWPDDGGVVELGDGLVSQVAATAPPPAIGDAAPAEGGSHTRPSGKDSSRGGARALLAQLERMGLAGGGEAVALRWQAPGRRAVPGFWVLVGVAAVSAAAILGAYGLTDRIRAARRGRAADVVTVVERQHASGRVEDLRAAERGLARLFALDSSRARELWLENRALTALLHPEPLPGMSDAVRRMAGQGMSPGPAALGRLVQTFGSRDLERAGALLPQLDGVAGGMATYQLAAAVVLEHAGDPGAIERYRRALELDANLAAANVLLTRLTLLERGAQPGRSAASTVGFDLDEHPIGRCLRRLQWALDPTRERTPPTGPLSDEERALLPRPLQPIPHLVGAVQATDRRERERAREQLQAGMALAETPAAIVRFGVVALQAGSGDLARRAALRAHAVAPDYPQLAGLAARVGLLEGRYEAAERAVSVVDATRFQLALVHAVVAYEQADDRGAALAARALGATGDQDPELRAVMLFEAVLRGDERPEADQLQDLALPAVFWGELVAVDSALDSGKLDLARALARDWGETRRVPAPFAVRVARMARYSGDPQRAARLAHRALQAGDPTPRGVVEAVLAELQLGHLELARSLLEAHVATLGAFHRWLDVLLLVQEKSAANARVRSSRLPLPRASAPLALWVLATRALVAGGDLRGREVAERLLEQHPDHPDLLEARRVLDE